MSEIDIKINDESIKEAIKTGDKHLGPTYDNLTAPVSKSIGNGIADIVDLVFSPFRYLNEKSNMFFEHKLKVYKKELEEKENSIPEDKKIEPDFHAVSLALDNSKFCITNDELRKMFVNLIGNTMNTDKKDIAHPAFSEIIKQMTTEDALILETFKNRKEQPIVEVRSKEGFCCYKTLIDKYFIPLIEDYDSDYFASSIISSNLERLGLLGVKYGSELSGDLYSAYIKDLKKTEKELSSKMKKKIKLTIEKGIVYRTQVGEAFIKACME